MRLRLSSIRARIAIAAAAAATVAAGALAFGFTAFVSDAVARQAVRGVEVEMERVTTQLLLGRPWPDIPLQARSDGTQIRIVDEATGTVLASSPVVTTSRTERPGRRELTIDVTTDPAAFPASSRLATASTVTLPTGQRFRVEAARDDGIIDVTRSTILRTALLVTPVVVAAIAALAWLLAGRALQPVDAMTAKAALLEDARDPDRIPEPGTNDEIDRLARVLNEMLDRFYAARRREQALLSDVAHELRTPLAALQARLDAEIERAPGNQAQLEAARGQVERVSRLVRGILDISRLEAAPRSTPEQRPVDLVDLARAAVGLYGSDRVTVHTTGAATVVGDPEHLTRVVTNLVDNALVHGGPTALVSISTAGRWCRLVVDDDGPGIPVDQRERVFDRFVRLDASRDGRTGGSGLGLAIVRAAVARHGGRVVADTSPLGGARVIVELPRSDVAVSGSLDV